MKKTQRSFNSTINKSSDKGKTEIKKRQVLKAYLIAEYGRRCMECGKYGYVELSHTEPIRMGGCRDVTKTTKENCRLLCRSCHDKRHPK